MTLLMFDTRIGKFALIVVAVAIALAAFGAPAVMEAAGGAQGGATEDNAYWLGFLGPLGLLIDWLSRLFG